MIGAWAFANSDTWAAYNSSLGVGAVGTAGFQSYTGGYMSGGTVAVTSTLAGTSALTTYSGGTLVGFGPGLVTNIQGGTIDQNQIIVLPAGGANTDYLRFAGVAENDLAFTNATDVLTLNQGGLMHSNSGEGSTIIGTPAIRGILNVGGTGLQELVIYNTNNTAAQTGAATNGTLINSNVLTMGSTANVFAGEAVSGTGVPTGSYVTSVLNGTQVTMNYAATSTATGQTFTFASNMVINSSITDNAVTGSQTRLNKSGTGTLTLTSGATELVFGASLVSGQSAITLPAGFGTFNGETVSGTGLPMGTTIVSGAGTTQLVLSNNATSSGASNLTFGTAGAVTSSTAVVGNSASITGLSAATAAGLYIGEPVTGTNIPAGALVAGVNAAGGIVTLSVPATGSGSPVTETLTFGVSAGNSYSGGTVINQGTVNLSGGAPGTVTIPAGNLTIVGGASATVVNEGITGVGVGGVTTVTGVGGQFDPTTVINLVGRSILNLAGINSINSLNFSNNGTAGAPTINVAPTATVPVSILNLTSSTPVVATSSNPTAGDVAVISGGTA